MTKVVPKSWLRYVVANAIASLVGDRDPFSSRMRKRIRRAVRRARAALRATAVFAPPSAARGVMPWAWLQAARVLRRHGAGPHTAVPLHAVLHPQLAAIADESRSLTWRTFDRE